MMIKLFKYGLDILINLDSNNKKNLKKCVTFLEKDKDFFAMLYLCFLNLILNTKNTKPRMMPVDARMDMPIRMPFGIFR